jgi:putative transposase
VVFSNSLRQRCLVHRCRNVLAKVPAHAQAEVKAAFWQIFDDIDAEPGEAAVARPASARTPSPTATTAATPPRWSACWPPCPS